jgi:chromatin modification-related protein VID21
MTNIPPQHRLPAPNPAPDLQLVMQARRISEQQRQAVQMQQQHQGPNPQVHSSPPNMRQNMNGINQQAFMQNGQAMMAAFSIGNGNGVSTPPANGFNVNAVGSAGSPRIAHPGQSQHPNGSISQVSKLEAQCRARAPTATPDQINKMVRDTLNQNLARQSAMHAAAGGGTSLPGMPSGMQASPQQYAQMLRAHQEKQSGSIAQQNRSSSAGSNSGLG